MNTTHSPASEVWARGYGVIRHSPETCARVAALAEDIEREGRWSTEGVYRLLAAADRLTSASMWVIAHMTYARRVDLLGGDLPPEAFKTVPEGHTGGSLNMAPAFVGYLLANALTGITRSWVMGQGHCVAAIEAVNALTGDVSTNQVGRYDRSEAGLSRLASDFYSYAITADGRPGVPLGSHAGANTAGAISEGGYLGFAEVQYVHMPLPGESLVAFLSDGAFEEQRGSDWSPRWWRAEDCGTAIPMMILNGRRIEERTQIAQEGGANWLASHLRLSGFDPLIIDGQDPAAIAWSILDTEGRLARFAADPSRRYPAPLPYVIAETTKGFGFPGAGTNAAHNLPLSSSPRTDAAAREAFNRAARDLYVPPSELGAAVESLATHQGQDRPRESRHPAAVRAPVTPVLPPPAWKDINVGPSCAMDAMDAWFVDLVDANPALRPRVGNPDELRSNHMGRTLERLRHRVNVPEPGVPEAVAGGVITALNEEAVAGAALGNKGGLNLIVSYEAFGVKMLGGLRQEIIFARHKREFGQDPAWIAVPLIVTSHTWENAKNEQSHQDPTLSEALLGEMSDTARVLFPIDANTAVATLREVYRARGQIACVVAPKRAMPNRFTGPQAERLCLEGAAHLVGAPGTAAIQFVTIGAYQAEQALRAANRLATRGLRACVTVLLEPARFRAPRDHLEGRMTVGDSVLGELFPPNLPRVILSHTRPEPMLGLLRRLDGGPQSTTALGYISRAGTLDVNGMLFANRCTWAHAVEAATRLLGWPREDLLSPDETAALDERGDPACLFPTES